MFYGYFNSIYNWIWSIPSSNTEDDKDGVVDFPKLPDVVLPPVVVPLVFIPSVAIEREPTSIMDKYEEYHEHLNEAIKASIDDPPWPGYGRKNKYKR